MFSLCKEELLCKQLPLCCNGQKSPVTIYSPIIQQLMDPGKSTCKAESFGISVDNHNRSLRDGELLSDFFGPAKPACWVISNLVVGRIFSFQSGTLSCCRSQCSVRSLLLKFCRSFPTIGHVWGTRRDIPWNQSGFIILSVLKPNYQRAGCCKWSGMDLDLHKLQEYLMLLESLKGKNKDTCEF